MGDLRECEELVDERDEGVLRWRAAERRIEDGDASTHRLLNGRRSRNPGAHELRAAELLDGLERLPRLDLVVVALRREEAQRPRAAGDSLSADPRDLILKVGHALDREV